MNKNTCLVVDSQQAVYCYKRIK